MEVVEEITLHPNAMYSNDFSKVAAFNPDTKHYLTKDIFSCVVSLPPSLSSVEEGKKIEDSLKFVNYTLPTNDTIHVNDYIVKMESINFAPSHKEYIKHEHDAGIGVNLSVTDPKADTTYYVEAALGMEGALMYTYPATIETVTNREHFAFQEGKTVFKFAVKGMADISADLLEKNNLTGADIAWLVPHQANLRIIDATAERMGLDKDKVMINIQRYGNTTAATIPLCLWEWQDQLNKDDLLVFAAFGGGFTWGATLVKWKWKVKGEKWKMVKGEKWKVKGGFLFHLFSFHYFHFSPFTFHFFSHSTSFLHPFGYFLLTSQSISTTPEPLFHYSWTTSEAPMNHSATTPVYSTGMNYSRLD